MGFVEKGLSRAPASSDPGPSLLRSVATSQLQGGDQLGGHGGQSRTKVTVQKLGGGELRKFERIPTSTPSPSFPETLPMAV